MLLLSENGIVGLEAILLKKRGITRKDMSVSELVDNSLESIRTHEPGCLEKD